MIRRCHCLAVLAVLLSVSMGRAAGIPVPPGVLAMWNGRDGAFVRGELRRYSAAGERPGASASERLEAGEAAYWLGVQDARAGRADSALAQWRRAWTLRGDFDEGFAIIDALFRRNAPDGVREARALAGTLAEQASMDVPQRSPEAHARLAWALHLLGHPDSALTEIRGYCADLHRRQAWTRRFASIELAAGDTVAAWRRLVVLSARTRQRDPEIEALVTQVQQTLHYSDERRRVSVGMLLDPAVAAERTFALNWKVRGETLHTKDGFPLQIFAIPAARDSVRRAPCLLVLSPADTVTTTDSLVTALALAGHPVALLAPRGTLGSLGPGAYGPEAWSGQEARFDAITVADASWVMDALGKRPEFGREPWIVGAVGERATAALAVARARRNVSALLLVAPRVPLVEIAEYRARLRTLKTRTFVQVSPEEPVSLELGDLLARDTAPGQVRVADSGLAGRGVAIFRGDRKVAARLLAWLEERRTTK